jgi:hypothetical protein
MKTFSNYLFYFILLSLLLSCDKMKILSEDYNHEDALTSSTKIVIESDIPFYYQYKDTIVLNKDSVVVKKEIFTILSKEKLENFGNLFVNSERTGYCCCPTTSYTISFYYHRNNFELYEVDTIEFKDKVRIFESSYQYSYLIEKKKWKEFLRSL